MAGLQVQGRASLLALGAVLLASTSPALAQQREQPFDSGNAILRECGPEADMSTKIYCLGYLAGMIEMDEVAARAGHPEVICLGGTGGVTMRQLLDVVVRYVQDHPATRHQSGSDLALRALGEAFPCHAAAPADAVPGARQ